VESDADDGRTLVRIDGSLAAGHAPVRIRRRIHDPGLFTGGAFARVLAELGNGPLLPVTRGELPETAHTVMVHRSLPLTDALASALKYSNNFCTEQVLRTLGWRATGSPGSWENGTETVARFWQATAQEPADLHFVNGSGLSRSGRATPRALVDLLARTEDDASPAAGLHSSLARAGGEGTLRLRLPRAHGRVRAKTGTLAGVSALSGIVLDGLDRELVFSILVEYPRVGGLNSSCWKPMHDEICVALATFDG
jgi:D-alanyl-D-alanine carboxypeptidase/D-alanyl-D-alanine-endopeptidase (penicillin-binding protein 4)